jgi:hypothetical protein
MRTHARRIPLVASTVLAALALSSCGLAADVAGVHAPPAENTSVAPIDADRAAAVATRVLGLAQEAEGKADAEGDTARAAALTGTALDLAKARATYGTAVGGGNALTKPEAPTVLASSAGTAYPRLLLTTTLDGSTRRQYLDLFSSSAVTAPYLLENRVAMLPGATLPALGQVAVGVAQVGIDDGTGLVMSPKAALEGYAAALNTPNPAANDAIESGDSYATALRAAQATQAQALGALATYAQTHTAVPESMRVLRLADGGAVVIARLNRSDVITGGENTKELKVPDALQKFTGAATAPKTITINATEAVAVLVPAEGKGKVALLGVTEQLVGGSVS